MRTLLVSLVVLALGFGGVYLVVSPGASAQSLVAGTFKGSVGTVGDPDAYEIDLNTGSGSVVAPGTYEFDITDYASIHNFDLCQGASCTGTNSLDKTSVSGTGSVQWIVNLTPGTYTYQCDQHPGALRGQFIVSSTPLVTASIKSVVAKRKLVTVAARANQTVKFNGWVLKGSKIFATTATTTKAATATLKLKPVPALKPGSYVVQLRATAGPGNFKTIRKKISVK